MSNNSQHRTAEEIASEMIQEITHHPTLAYGWVITRIQHCSNATDLLKPNGRLSDSVKQAWQRLCHQLYMRERIIINWHVGDLEWTRTP